ncbi:MAG: COX15/CtaA family protein [Candidatus Hydrogenedentes bacterium]|nr:COX15/CtaA family protein [Candidatus Hydrogenedentota bacterium]
MIQSFFTPRAFRIVGLTTVVAVYFLIAVGGIVRASGAGMGCPDWPTCFGQWIPPTDESQLPANYQEIYAERGYADTTFNVVKTWTEYINRLIGVTIGILIFLTLVSSYSYWQTDRTVTVLSFVSFLLVAFQGWLGAKVVESNLTPLLITAHMVIALLLVSILLYVVVRAQRSVFHFGTVTPSPGLQALMLVVLGLSLLQVVMGTQVRETIDKAVELFGEDKRYLWAESLGFGFYVHRTFSMVVFAVNFALAMKIVRETNEYGIIQVCAIAANALILFEIATGAALYYLAMPAVLQPTHLLLANLIFGLQFFMLLGYRYGSANGKEATAQ